MKEIHLGIEKYVCDFCGVTLGPQEVSDAGYGTVDKFKTHACVACYELVKRLAREGQLNGIETNDTKGNE